MILYYNLSANAGDRNIYIRSTDVETKRWDKLLLSFPDEALYFLSLGHEIVIQDSCCKPHGKIERIFCPAMSDFLRMLTGYPIIHKTLKFHSNKAFEFYNSNKIIKWKYDAFKNKIKKEPIIKGKTIFCEKEPSVWTV